MNGILHLTLFGPPHIRVGDQLLTGFATKKAQALFFYLAVSARPGASYSRDVIATLLWSEMTDTQARQNLRAVLPELRHLVGVYLQIERQTLAFQPASPYYLDVEKLRASLTPSPTTANLAERQAAVNLYQGEFLHGFIVHDAPLFDTWVLEQREALHTLVVNALTILVDEYAQAGDVTAALAANRRLLILEPWSERTHSQQMTLLAQIGERAAALAQYEACRRILATEFGIEPLAETTALYEQIRKGGTRRQGEKEQPESGGSSLSGVSSLGEQANPERMTRDVASLRQSHAGQSAGQMLPIQPIRAKISIPGLPLDLVARPRLVARLNQSLTQKLTLVCAPAGYGKSTLVSEWLYQLSAPNAWISLDEGDDDLFSFLSYVVAAVRTRYPSFGEAILPLLAASTLPALPILVAALLRDFESLEAELVLVLDDLYRLAQLPIYELLERLIAYLPPSVHLVLSTRTDPLMSLVSLRARGQLSEVRQRDLRFTSEETRAFVAQTTSLAAEDVVDEETLVALETRTDGWAVGLRLFLLSVHNKVALGKLTKASSGLDVSDINSYLVGEVVRKQAPLMQDFLLYIAIVERFSLPLCVTLFQQATSPQIEEMLQEMQRQNLFVTALGEGWYRYHPLLRELLLNRLERQMTAEALSELHRRAAAWYESQRMVSEALYHLLAAPDETAAIEVLARHRLEAINYEQIQQLAHWLSFFPQRMLEQQPLLSMTQAWVFESQSHITRYMAIAQRVKVQLAEGIPPLEPATAQLLEGEVCALFSGWLLHYDRQFQAALASARRALELLPFDHAAGRASTYNYLITGLNHSGDLAGAQEALARALQEEGGRDDDFGPRMMVPKFNMAYLAMDTGGMEEAATQMAAWAEQRHLSATKFSAHLYQGQLAYTRNELDLAYRHFDEAVTRRDVVHVGGAAMAYIFLVLIHQARGEAAAALQILDTAEAFVRDSAHPPAMVIIEATRAFQALLQGRTSEALAWAARQELPPALVPRSFTTREGSMVLIKTLVSDNSAESMELAAALLPSMLATARTSHAHFLTAELLTLQAKLSLNQGNQEAALAHLSEAVTLVRRAQPLRLFADLGLENSRSLIPLFEELNRRDVAPEYLPRLLEVLGHLNAPPVPVPTAFRPSLVAGLGRIPHSTRERNPGADVARNV